MSLRAAHAVRDRGARWGAAWALFAAAAFGCTSRSDTPTGGEDWDPAPYQAAVEEGLGAAVAIVIDTSGSMSSIASGDTRSKHEVARAAVQRMLEATEDFMARRPDFPIKIAVLHFSSRASLLLPIQAYHRAALHAALAALPRPGGGTAIGDAMLAARPELYRAGTFRKYLLVITDGENTHGRAPELVARQIYRKSEGAVGIYFVAFDTSPEKFAFLREVGGDVIAAQNADELRKGLDEIYQGRILAEEIAVEPAPERGRGSGEEGR